MQKKFFLQEEADKWFERNKEQINQKSNERISLFSKYILSGQKKNP